MTTEELTQFDANVDDLDPRLLPRAIDQLLAAGAVDAWVTPIIMKKGRPAFTVSALCDRSAAPRVRTTLFRETSTIGVRETTVIRHALDRTSASVEVDGHPIGVKIARLDGETVNTSVEWSDVERAAEATGRSAKTVLADATAAAANVR